MWRCTPGWQILAAASWHWVLPVLRGTAGRMCGDIPYSTALLCVASGQRCALHAVQACWRAAASSVRSWNEFS